MPPIHAAQGSCLLEEVVGRVGAAQDGHDGLDPALAARQELVFRVEGEPPQRAARLLQQRVGAVLPLEHRQHGPHAPRRRLQPDAEDDGLRAAAAARARRG